MVNYNCIIIDDDHYAIEGLKRYIALIPSLILMDAYTDPVKALMELSEAERIDLILMDIDMPHMTGIELSKTLRAKTRKLIFTTAHTQYGYEAFEVEADAYLLKPYSFSKFAATISRLFASGVDTPNEFRPNDDYFFVKNKEENHKLVKIHFTDVVTVESKQNYVMIHTVNKHVLTYMSLTEIGGILEQFPDFVKYHRSFIINRRHIESVTGNMLKMSNGSQIMVGDNFRKNFLTFLDAKLLKASRK